MKTIIICYAEFKFGGLLNQRRCRVCFVGLLCFQFCLEQQIVMAQKLVTCRSRQEGRKMYHLNINYSAVSFMKRKQRPKQVLVIPPSAAFASARLLCTSSRFHVPLTANISQLPPTIIS